MKIVFMGTPEFAVASLDLIHQSHHQIVAVVTAPDKPAGRGLKMQFSEVKEYALTHNIPILQPEKLKDPQFIAHLKSLNAEVFVVVAFRMLPVEVFTIPPKGTFNIHGSLLPQYRGAAPIHWAVINGETKTGVTSFFLNQEIDKGDIINSKQLEIGSQENTGDIYQKLKHLGGVLAVETLSQIESNTILPIPQSSCENTSLKPAPKLNKENTLIDWNKPALEIYNLIRGLAPFPTAYTRIRNLQGEIQIIKCFKAEIIYQKNTQKAGTIITDNRKKLAICCSDYQISLIEIQLQGKSKMVINTFLQGFRADNYTLELF
jgi:methionyl-tRNA formyltransferase